MLLQYVIKSLVSQLQWSGLPLKSSLVRLTDMTVAVPMMVMFGPHGAIALRKADADHSKILLSSKSRVSGRHRTLQAYLVTDSIQGPFHPEVFGPHITVSG